MRERRVTRGVTFCGLPDDDYCRKTVHIVLMLRQCCADSRAWIAGCRGGMGAVADASAADGRLWTGGRELSLRLACARVQRNFTVFEPFLIRRRRGSGPRRPHVG